LRSPEAETPRAVRLPGPYRARAGGEAGHTRVEVEDRSHHSRHAPRPGRGADHRLAPGGVRIWRRGRLPEVCRACRAASNSRKEEEGAGAPRPPHDEAAVISTVR